MLFKPFLFSDRDWMKKGLFYCSTQPILTLISLGFPLLFISFSCLYATQVAQNVNLLIFLSNSQT